MKNLLKIAALSLSAAVSSQAFAIQTAVQISPGGLGTGSDGSYEIAGITEFDWQSTGDLVIIDDSANGNVQGTDYTSFSGWLVAATASILAGEATSYEVTYDLESHARLNDLIAGGGSVADTNTSEGFLDRNGAASGDFGYEITAALMATETAVLTVANGIQTLTFTDISGTYKYYLDTDPNSDVDAGTGFTDGVNFLSGTIDGVIGSAVFDPNTGGFGGDNILTNSVTSYLTAYIQTDPDSNAPLLGSTFDTLVSLAGTLDLTGDQIGLTPHTVGGLDLVFKADANSEFSAEPMPAPQTLLLFSLGLLGLHASARRKRAA